MVSVFPGSKDTLLSQPETHCFPYVQSEPLTDISLPCLVSIQPIADILTFNRLSRLSIEVSIYHGNDVSNDYLALRESHKIRNHQVERHLMFTFPISTATNWNVRRTVLEMEMRFLCIKHRQEHICMSSLGHDVDKSIKNLKSSKFVSLH